MIQQNHLRKQIHNFCLWFPFSPPLPTTLDLEHRSLHQSVAALRLTKAHLWMLSDIKSLHARMTTPSQ